MGSVSFAVGPVTVDLLDDDRICRHVLAGKTFEPKSLEAWARMCEPGSIVIDVGAYSGLFSIAAAKLGAFPIAIEPQPIMCDRIDQNSRLNGVEFHTINAAASDTAGTARLGVNETVHLTSGASLLRKSGAGIKVRTIRLDDLDVDRVSAVKIDVERAETLVLAGALGLLEKHRPKLLVEALDAAAVAAVKDMLPAYRLEAILDDRNMVLVPA